MKLYHYTSIDHLQQILTDNEIKLTCSNLLKPKNLKIVNEAFIDETDGYKPVVWFTSILDFDRAKQCGLVGGNSDKTEAAIEVDIPCPELQSVYKWDSWAKANNIDEEWFLALKTTAPLWNSFYISERPVKIDDRTEIIFRPDIKKLLESNMN